ncbi:glucose kinase [Leptospira perolatii]|uniref:Glucose kinase n=1 Tax=Leptospira perolatii TaxID=2023191 RepID=A0A2M9ZNH3_9LEPT|nr:ROK family protein [Leptospira perolatii]PJZ69651.1 glucose kinase [Leptospira perolatii]PJZ73638.1 glucose kinase [Leptospira perolatii]
MNSFLGVDIGATSIKASLSDSEGKIYDQSSAPTGPNTDNGSFLDSLEKLIENLVQNKQKTHPDLELSGIGIGSPGPIDRESGILISSANLPKLKQVRVVDRLKEKFRLPVYYDNDANCAALGEYWFGPGKGSPNLLVLTLGTGLGGGWIYEGKLFEGYKGNGMEVGHTTLKPAGALCGCGQRGCAEAYFSASGFSARMYERSGGKIENAEEFFDLVTKGDPNAKETLEEGVRILAELLRNMIHTINPECIVLSGGLSGSYHLFGKQLENRVREIIFPVFVGYTRFVAGGSVTGTIGAASLCMGKNQ